MAVFETKIADLLRSVATSLQLSMLLPATAFVATFAWLFIPLSLTKENANLLVFVLAIITVAYLLHAFNMPIIRLFEGYILMDTLPLTMLRHRQIQARARHYARIRRHRQKIRDLSRIENQRQLERRLSEADRERIRLWKQGWSDRIAHERERLEERYPPTLERVLPTAFGNVIAASELYPELRYHIDIAQIWPRFVPTLVNSGYSGFIEGEKAILDFLINLLLVCGAIWGLAVPVFALSGQPGPGLLVAGLPFLGYVLYRGACVAASNWGVTVKSAFDLYRLDLKDAMNLRLSPAAGLVGERSMWRGVSEFLAYGRTENFQGFEYERQIAARGAKTPEESKE